MEHLIFAHCSRWEKRMRLQNTKKNENKTKKKGNDFSSWYFFLLSILNNEENSKFQIKNDPKLPHFILKRTGRLSIDIQLPEQNDGRALSYTLFAKIYQKSA